MKQFKLLLFAFCAILFTGCEGDPKDIFLTDGQKSEVQVSYDNASYTVAFEATADWTATVTPVQRSSEIDWLHLDQTSGSAGTINLSFSMDGNYSGERRSACIVVTCNGSSIVITITQLPEGEDPNENDDDENGSDDELLPDESMAENIATIHLTSDSYYFVNNEAQLDRREDIRIEYLKRKDGIIWPDNMFVEVYAAESETIDTSRWKIEHTESTIYARCSSNEWNSVHKAGLDESHRKVVTGGYSSENGATNATYSIEYEDGRISKSALENGSSYSFEWIDGNMTSINDNQSGVATNFTYSEHHTPFFYGFNLNWLLTHGENLDHSIGDPSRIWALLGYLGSPSEHLISSYTTPDGITTDIEYTHISDERTECIVVEWRNGSPLTRTELNIAIH